MIRLILLSTLLLQCLFAQSDLKEDLEVIFEQKIKYDKQLAELRKKQEIEKRKNLNDIKLLREEKNKQQVKSSIIKIKSDQYNLTEQGQYEKIDYLLAKYNSSLQSIITYKYVDVINYIKINGRYSVKVKKQEFDNTINTLISNAKEYMQYKNDISRLNYLKQVKNANFLKSELKQLNKSNYNQSNNYSSNNNRDNKELKTIEFLNSTTHEYNNILQITFLTDCLKIEIK